MHRGELPVVKIRKRQCLTVEKAGYLVSENELDPNIDPEVEESTASADDVNDFVEPDEQEPVEAAADAEDRDDVPASDEQTGDEQTEADEVAVKAPAGAAEEMATYEDKEKAVAEPASQTQKPTDSEAHGDTYTEDKYDQAVADQSTCEQEPTDTQAHEPAAKDPDQVPAELRPTLRRSPGEWYVVHTYSGYERHVKANLQTRSQTLEVEDDIYEIEVPMEEVVEFKNTVRKVINRVRVPGYVLVRMEMTEDAWAAVRHTPGVTGFVGNAYDPVPLTQQEVFDMLAPSLMQEAAKEAEKAGAPLKGEAAQEAAPEVSVDFQVGDSVIVKEGPFESLPASISEV